MLPITKSAPGVVADEGFDGLPLGEAVARGSHCDSPVLTIALTAGLTLITWRGA